MNTSLISLHLITILACTTCSFFYIKTACFYFKPKFNPNLYSCVTAFIMGLIVWSCTFLNNEIISCLIFIIVEILIIRIGLASTNIHALIAAIASTFHTMCIKGIVVGVLAIFMKKNLYQIITVSDRLLTAIIITMVLKMCAPLLYKNKQIRDSFRTLFRSENELEAVLLQHTALFIIMLFFSYNYYYNLDLIWFTIAQIILSILMLTIYYLVLYYGVRISSLLENEIANIRIQQQLNDTIAQYVSYQSMFKKIEDFKYHFREQMLVIETFMSNGSIVEAQRTLKAAIPLLLEKLPSRKIYSNNDPLNALLLDWDAHCKTNNTQFESKVYLPPEFERREKEILSVLAIIEDMYSYITKSSDKPTIKVEGKVLQGNFVLNVTGSICGTVEQRNHLPYFNTPHGLQVNRLYQKLFSVSEQINGILFWNFVLKDHTFQIVFSIHQ